MHYMNTCIKTDLRPGTILRVSVGPVWHKGIVSDRVGSDGWPMVISNSKQRGEVAEESFRRFCSGQVAEIETQEHCWNGERILRRARSLLGTPWHALSFNCEHFVEHAVGREPSSPQFVRALVCAGVLVLILVAISKP
jgi:hypothetical protein